MFQGGQALADFLGSDLGHLADVRIAVLLQELVLLQVGQELLVAAEAAATTSLRSEWALVSLR